MKKSTVVSLSYLSLSFLLSWTNLAYAAEDRDATPEEKAKVSNALKASGCPSVGDIDFNLRTNLFEADDVVCSDGKKYDVYLDAKFNIVSKREDRD